jgi:hypothetical protein
MPGAGSIELAHRLHSNEAPQLAPPVFIAGSDIESLPAAHPNE